MSLLASGADIACRRAEEIQKTLVTKKWADISDFEFQLPMFRLTRQYLLIVEVYVPIYIFDLEQRER